MHNIISSFFTQCHCSLEKDRKKSTSEMKNATTIGLWTVCLSVECDVNMTFYMAFKKDSLEIVKCSIFHSSWTYHLIVSSWFNKVDERKTLTIFNFIVNVDVKIHAGILLLTNCGWHTVQCTARMMIITIRSFSWLRLQRCVQLQIDGCLKSKAPCNVVSFYLHRAPI